MAISSQDFTTIVRNQVAAIQGAVSSFIDLTIGSALLAIVEANAAVALWLQGMILTLLATTRASTSSGADLDSWMADYGLVRLPAVAASGQVTFSRFTPTMQAIVPVGATVETADGSQQFTVLADTTNTAYSASLNGFVVAPGYASVTVTVQAVVPGSAANASAGQVSTLTQSIPGIDTVSNAAAFINGVDAETDLALRARFIVFLAGLSKATKAAIGFAIQSVQDGVSYTLVENQTYLGVAQPGYFYAVVDDGSGHPPSTFLNTVANAIDAVRPITSTFGVYGPTLLSANVVMTLTTAASYNHAATTALVVTALQTYINALPMGQELPFSRLAQVAYDTSAGVTNVTGITLNGASADLTASAAQIIKAGTITVN